MTKDELGIVADIHTVEFLQEVAEKLEGESVYASEEFEDWSFDEDEVILAVTTDGKIEIPDDCDWQRAALYICKLCGWDTDYLAECAVKSGDGPGPFNHYIALAWVDSEQEWYGFNCWSYGEAVRLPDIVAGNYEINDGNWAAEVTVNRHHVLTDWVNGRPQWYGGLPPRR